MAATKTVSVLELAKQILDNKDDPKTVLTIARRGARLFPTEVLPGDLTFGQLVEKFQAAQVRPAAGNESVPKPAPRKAAPRKAAARKAEPPVETVPETPKVQTQVLALVHDGETQTSIFGVEKDSPAHLALGKKSAGGLGWSFWYGNKSWYIRGSQGFAPDMAAIGEAVTRLESLTLDGVQLYRVDQQITATRADGTALPVKRTREQAQAWQRAYDAAFNSGTWNLSVGRGVCGGCGVQGLSLSTGRIGKGEDGMPRTECGTCGGFAAPEPQVESVPEPVVELARLVEALALPAPTEREACHACTTVVAVVDGQYALHSDPRGGACRAKRGVKTVDVEAEPVVKPVKRAARKVKAADLGIVVTPATGLVVTLSMQSQMSGMQVKNTATEVRQVLSRKVRGVKIETRRDKATKRLTLTVIEGGEGFDADALTDQIIAAAKTVRGVANRVHAA